MLDVPIGTVMSRIHRGRALLRAALVAEPAMSLRAGARHGLRGRRARPRRRAADRGPPRRLPGLPRAGGRRARRCAQRLRALPAPELAARPGGARPPRACARAGRARPRRVAAGRWPRPRPRVRLGSRGAAPFVAWELARDHAHCFGQAALPAQVWTDDPERVGGLVREPGHAAASAARRRGGAGAGGRRATARCADRKVGARLLRRTGSGTSRSTSVPGAVRFERAVPLAPRRAPCTSCARGAHGGPGRRATPRTWPPSGGALTSPCRPCRPADAPRVDRSSAAPGTMSFSLWGCSAVGSAREWHSRGHGFDPHQLHQLRNNLATGRSRPSDLSRAPAAAPATPAPGDGSRLALC